MTTKQRAYLKGLAMTMEPIFQIGKGSISPSLVSGYFRGTGSERADKDQCTEELCR